MDIPAEVGRALPPLIRSAVEKYAPPRLEEIRIRCKRPVQLVYSSGNDLLPYTVTAEDCATLMENISEHSAYAYEEELNSCFVTLRGGCRVGLSGRMRGENGNRRLTDVTGFNIRIARERIGCADNVMPMLIKNGAPLNTLVFSTPGVGKTTLLRDIARQLSCGANGIEPRKVCIADERSELAGCYLGVPELDVGPRTDVMDGCKKADAMRLMIRSMSPEVIMTDELQGQADAEAVTDAVASGVAVIASAHAAALSELVSRAGVGELVRGGVFERLILLTRDRGRVMQEIVR